MKSGWYAHEDHLSYSFADYVGFVHIRGSYNKPFYIMELSEGAGGRSVSRRYHVFSEAVHFIENFSELSFDERHEQFEMMVKECH